MAFAPLTRCSRCRRNVTRNRPAVCDACKELRRPQRDTRPSAAARGYDRRWRTYREAYLIRHPLCGSCKAAGRVTAATVVDHIRPHRGDLTLFWAAENHQPLCARCHNCKTARGQ